MRGRYIVLEGGEGSGKDEQKERLLAFLKQRDIDVISAREPGTTEFSEKARKEMLTSDNTSAMTQFLIVSSARSDTVEHINEWLDQGKWVVCTRNWLSSYAMQGHAMGIDKEIITDISAAATHGVEPDATILLDIDENVAEKRRDARGGTDDSYDHRYEKEALDFQRKVREGYLDAAKRFGYNVVDASGTMNQVAQKIREIITKMEDKPTPDSKLSAVARNGVYSNKQIKQAVKDGHIVFHPYKEEHIAGSSVDVTLGEWFYRTEKDSKNPYYNPFDPDDVDRYFEGPHKAIPHKEWAQANRKKRFKGIPDNHPIIVLAPGERILAHTHEFIGIKAPGTSTMQARSSWGRNGVAVCLDAGWGDPGYINRWTMEIYNMNQHESVVLPVGERIAQLVFYTTGEVENQYSSLSGKYQASEDSNLQKLIDGWKPQEMLPKSYKDSRELPASLALKNETATYKPESREASAISEIIEKRVEATSSNDEPYVEKNKHGVLTMTKAGKTYLEDAITDTEGNVYAFKGKLTNATVAAAMARLSRRGDDMRITILDEFTNKSGDDEGVLHRVISAYGDDSVQQLAGIHLVVENASNLLTKKLEWGRLAAYLEQSTRYIFFDKKDANGNYRYYTPPNLDAQTAKRYEQTMDNIFDTYSKMVRELTKYVRDNSDVPKDERDGAWKGATRAQACDAIRNVLPVATKSTVGIFASAQAAESLYMHLMADDLQESKNTGEALLKQLRAVMPVFFERADKPDRGGAAIAYAANTRKAMRKIADEHLSQNLSPETQAVKLVDHWPKNEMDLLPHMLFEHSSSSLAAIESEVEHWPYERKVTAFNTYLGERLNRRHKPGRALENAHYSWELVCDYGIFRDLQRHRLVDDLRWQELTPRYGFDMSALVEEAGLTELFESCFDMSFELYSAMQGAGYEAEAQYATLLGHKMRWKIVYNAREAFHFHELRTAPQGHPGYRKLVKEMHDTVAEVHPMLTAAMKFVNKDEDPALTRLAAERYTQFKLQEIGTKKKP